jgi:hypothetical protein
MTDFKEKDISNLFANAKEDFASEINPYLKTRILANVAANPATDNIWSFLQNPWLMFLQGGLVALVLIFAFNKFNEGQIQGMVGQAYAINIELEKINKNTIAFIKIDLPSEVQFYTKSSESFLKDKRTLTLPISTLEAFEKFPVVIKSHNKGLKQIKLTLLDDKKKIVKERHIKMNFFYSKELVF